MTDVTIKQAWGKLHAWYLITTNGEIILRHRHHEPSKHSCRMIDIKNMLDWWPQFFSLSFTLLGPTELILLMTAKFRFFNFGEIFIEAAECDVNFNVGIVAVIRMMAAYSTVW